MSVSVVIPAYNAEAFITRAIDSVLHQTWPASEIIVVDDGSTDSTVSLIQRYGDAVRLISQRNSGPARARNLGVRSSSGKYIAFLDADDWWDLDKIERQVLRLQEDANVVASYTSLRLRHADGHTSVEYACDTDKLQSMLRICNPKITPSCVMVTRKAFDEAGGFNESQKGCEDWDLLFRLRKIGPFASVSRPLTNYTVSNTSLSADADRVFNDFQNMLDSVLLRDLKGIPRSVWRRKAISYQAFKAALTARGTPQEDKEMSYMLRSILLWPSPFWQPLRFKAFAVTLLRTRHERYREG